MPVHPQIRALLDAGAALPPLETLGVAEARARYEAVPRPPPRPVARVEEHALDGPAGPLRVRAYHPEGAGPHPVLVYFHGSGFVLCSLDTHDGLCRNLCAGSGHLVLSVDYRLAPEHKYPAATEDCLHAVRWAGAHAAALGGDPARLSVGGDSAGGNLATVTALRLRDEGGPALLGQLLVYPVTGHHAHPTPSWTENGAGYGLTARGMTWFLDHYLRGPADAADPLAVPLLAPSLTGLPPALVQVAQYDLLRDEGRRYAARLQDDGVLATLTCWPGMNHGFLQWAGRVAPADAAMDEATAWLRRIAARPATTGGHDAR